MNELYYEIESILNELPQRSIAEQLQKMIYSLLVQDKQSNPILEIEHYFRNLIKQIEFYYCRRLQKLDYFISHQSDQALILLRIQKYISKKPWRLETMDYLKKKKKQTSKLDDKNCNQILEPNEQINNFDYLSSKTSTPFSHYSQIPSLQKDSTLNQAVFFDFDDTLSESSKINDQTWEISKIQKELETMMHHQSETQARHADFNDLYHDDLLDQEVEIGFAQDSQLNFDISDILVHEDHQKNANDLQNHEKMILDEFNEFNESPIKKSEFISSPIVSDQQILVVQRQNLDRKPQKKPTIEIDDNSSDENFNSDKKINDNCNKNNNNNNNNQAEADNLFNTHQSTKEIIKYVEQYQSQQSARIEKQQQEQQQQQQIIQTQNRQRIQSSHEQRRPLLYDLFTDNKIQSPSYNKKYRVRSSYQKEVPQIKLKNNTSHESIFEVRTSKSLNQKKKQITLFLPSPLTQDQRPPKKVSIQSQYSQQNQQKVKLKNKQTYQSQHNSMQQKLYQRFTQIKQTQPYQAKRQSKQNTSYSQDRNLRMEGFFEAHKLRRTLNIE